MIKIFLVLFWQKIVIYFTRLKKANRKQNVRANKKQDP